MTSDVPVLGLSGLFVMLSIKVIPAWCNKHRAEGRGVRIFSILALVATLGATAWLTWAVASLGVDHASAQQPESHVPLVGTVLGIPVVMIPLAILLGIVGVAELRARGVGAGSFSLPVRRAPQTLDVLREEISGAAITSRAVLVDAISQIDASVSTRIEERAKLQASTGTAIETMQGAVSTSVADLSGTLDRVASVCAMVTDRIEAQRLEPDPLVEVITRLNASASVPRKVSAAEPGGSPADIEISLVEDDHDDEPPPNGPVTKPSADPAPYRDTQPTGPLTTVERLRMHAQRMSREMFTRGRPQPSRSGRTPSE